MSKKVVRSRESYIKNWTAAITGSFVLVSAQAAQAEHQRGAFRDFRTNNPGLEKRDLRQAFREQFGAGGLSTCPVPNSSGGSNPNAPAINDNASRHQQRIEAKLLRHNGAINQSFQANVSGQFNNIQRGVDLDLTSQVANITLGSKLFGNTSSVEIQVGGVTKTVNAGSQVTAAEYVAAKQVLAGVGQKVTIGSGGAATGGDVDLSAITGKGDVLRASDLTVPVNVTTTGDFSKGSEFRLLGDLTNSGTVHALDGSGNGRGGTLRADSILNNSGALISSDVDLNLQGDKSITNYGTITSAGNLTLTSASVTNRGSISSANDVSLNAAPDAASLSVDNAGGTISAANNINVNTNDLNANLSGGDYLSQNLNLNAGAGTIDANVGNVTGDVVSTGNAVHFAAASETLNIGETNLIDPTFYNLGNINFTGSINVAGADLTVIATGNITESAIGDFTISTTGPGAGGNLTMIAGANITGTSAAASPNVNGGTASDVTFNQGSIAGGSILLGNAQMVTSGAAGGKGGDVLLAAFGGTGANSGVIDLNVGTLTATGSNITTSGNGAGANGNVTMIAPNGIDIDRDNGNGSITALGGTGGGGNVVIVTAQPTSAGPVTYLSTGALASLGLTPSNVVGNSTVDINDINADGLISVISGSNTNVRNLTAQTGNISLFVGRNPFAANAVIDPAATLTLNGDVGALGGSILLETADNVAQGNNNDLFAFNDVVVDVGIGNGLAPGGADYSQLGSVFAQNGQIFITVGDSYTAGNGAADAIGGAAGVNILVGVQSGTGNMTSVATITAGDAAVDGSINILVAGDFLANSTNADIAAGQGNSNFVGSVNISAGNLQTIAGADILGRDVSLTSNTTAAAANDFDLAGSVAANNGSTGGAITLTLTGANTSDISDNDVTGGLFAKQITLTNNAVGGTISILNNATPINFIDVTANAVGNITLVEPSGGGRDGNINFTGLSNSGGTFNVIADSSITSSIGAVLSGVTGNLKSNGVGGNGNIGSTVNRLSIDFTDFSVQVLGVPSITAGNAFLDVANNVNFAGPSQVTGVLDMFSLGDITSSPGNVVYANTALLFAVGSIGTSILNPFTIDVGTGAGQGIAAVGFNNAFLFDPTDSKIIPSINSPSGSFGTFSFVSGGSLIVTDTVLGGNIILSAANTLNLGVGITVDSTFDTNGDTTLSGAVISSGAGSKVIANNLNVFLNGGTGVINTKVVGLTSTGSTGSLTVTEDDGIDLNDQGALTDLTVNAGTVSTGDVVTNNNFSVGTLLITNLNAGDILVNSDVTGTSSLTLDTSGSSGAITSGSGAVLSPSITLKSSTGSIDVELGGLAAGSTTVTANAASGGDVKIAYLGTDTLILEASTGNNNFSANTTVVAAKILIDGALGGTGTLRLNTTELDFNGAFNLTFNDAIVTSLGLDLTINGANGTFTTSAAGPGVTFTGNGGSFLANGLTNFVGGDLLVNGINSFSVPTFGGLNGDTTNDVTIQAAVVLGASLANLTNWNSINLLGNTIYNSAGDVVLPGNLTFTGQNLAIIASGNVTATGITIDLGSATGDGGSLTILAGVDSSPASGGQKTTTLPVTINGFNTVGGSIDLTGSTITTTSSSATGNAGSVFIYAYGGTGPGTGFVTTGDINANSINGSGASVAVGANNGVTVGSILTTGFTGSGDVLLGVGTLQIVGTPVFTGGVLSGGSFAPLALTSGSLSHGAILAGKADIVLAGAFAAGDTIGGGTVTGDDLEIIMGAGSVVVSSNINEVQVDATAAANGSLLVFDGGSIDVDHIDGSNLAVQIVAANDINLIGNVNTGGGSVALQAQNITTLATAKVTTSGLDVNVSGTGTVNTATGALTTSGSAGSLTINEDDGIDLSTQTVASLTVNAGQVAAGNVETVSNFSVTDLTINSDAGDVFINTQVTGTNSVTIDTTGGVGTGGIAGTGTVLSPTINLFTATNDITLQVNGVANANTTVTANSSTNGDVSLTYLGTGEIRLQSSSGNGNYTIAGSAANGGDIVIDGNIDGSGTLSLTTDNLIFNGASTLDFDDATVQSFTGSGLTLTGAGGTFETLNGVTMTATTGSFIGTGTTNFNGGNLAVTLATNNGINSFDITAGILNGDTTNDVTVTAALIIAPSLMNLTNWDNIIVLQGNTIVNNSGDVVLPGNLIFNGKSLAIIASGNVTTTGATLIDLSSTTGDGGSLTVLAGFTSSGTPVGDMITQTADPVTVTGFSASGGNINLTGVNINTSSTVANAGDVTLIAQSPGILATPGTVVVGNITANGAIDGGEVNVGGYGGVTVGNISAVGGTGANGFVAVGVVEVDIVGTPVYTNGVLSGGSLEPVEGETGNLTYGTINAGAGDVILAGGFGAANTIGGGQITAGNLTVVIGAGSANLSTTVDSVEVDAAAVSGGSVSLTETDGIAIQDVTGSDVDLAVTTTANVDIAGNVGVGSGTVSITADDITQSLGTLTALNLSLSTTGDVTLVTNITNLLDSSFANMTLNNTGALTINDIATPGLVDIFNSGNLTVASNADIDAVNRITLQTVGANPGNILIGTGANIQTNGAVKSGNGEGDILILQGIAPSRTRALRGRNLVVNNTQGPVLTGRGRSSDGSRNARPVGQTFNGNGNNLSAINATLLIKAQVRNGVILAGDTTIIADPPLAPGALTTSAATAPGRNNDAPAQMTQALLSAPSVLAPINTIPTLTTPTVNLNALSNTISNLATANTTLGALNQMEDDSYIVTYAPMGQIVDGNVCSDMDFGFVSGGNAGSGNAVATMQHSDCVTLDNGSALFVPSKDMTVVTPKGSVKLAANSVAYVNVNSNQLSVYDINDSHKASVVVSAGGRDLTLSPGRHLVVTHDKAKNFAEVNPIESIMHRAVKGHELGAGKRAFISEFSIPSAVNVVKPLKAMLNSNDADAKKVAARILKTSAVVMMVGGQAPFDFHTKPRTVALSWK